MKGKTKFGHTHEAADQMFNKLSEFLVKKDTRTSIELVTSFESCYTPTPKAAEVEHVFAVKEGMSPISLGEWQKGKLETGKPSSTENSG